MLDKVDVDAEKSLATEIDAMLGGGFDAASKDIKPDAVADAVVKDDVVVDDTVVGTTTVDDKDTIDNKDVVKDVIADKVDKVVDDKDIKDTKDIVDADADIDVDANVDDGEIDWRQEINKMAKANLDGNKVEKVAKKEDVKPTDTVDDSTKKMVVPSDFSITEDEFDAAQTNKEGFETVMKKVDSVFASRLENLIRVIPEIIQSIAGETISSRLAVSDFFQINKDLVPFRELVMLTSNKMSAKFPAKDVSDLMADTGKEVRKILKLDKRNTMKTVKKKRTPAVIDSGGGASRGDKGPELSDMEKEIGEMLKLG